MAVIGGADTGCQIASIFAALGSQVTILDAGQVLVPSADADVSAALAAAFSARGMTVRTGTLATALAQDGNVVRIDLSCDRARGQADADAEGRTAARNAVLGVSRQARYAVVPSGSFTDPEYGRVGLTQARAAARHDVVAGTAHYADLLRRPVADGRPDGFCKLIADRDTHLILGGHVLGEYSAETVQTIAACMAAGLTVEQVAELQLAFPTFTEGVSLAALRICREIGIGSFPQLWSFLRAGD